MKRRKNFAKKFLFSHFSRFWSNQRRNHSSREKTQRKREETLRCRETTRNSWLRTKISLCGRAKTTRQSFRNVFLNKNREKLDEWEQKKQFFRKALGSVFSSFFMLKNTFSIRTKRKKKRFASFFGKIKILMNRSSSWTRRNSETTIIGSCLRIISTRHVYSNVFVDNRFSRTWFREFIRIKCFSLFVDFIFNTTEHVIYGVRIFVTSFREFVETAVFVSAELNQKKRKFCSFDFRKRKKINFFARRTETEEFFIGRRWFRSFFVGTSSSSWFPVFMERISIKIFFWMHVQPENRPFHWSFVLRIIFLDRDKLQVSKPFLRSTMFISLFELLMQLHNYQFFLYRRTVDLCPSRHLGNFSNQIKFFLPKNDQINDDVSLPVTSSLFSWIHFEIRFFCWWLWHFSIFRFWWIDVFDRTTEGSEKRTFSFAEKFRCFFLQILILDENDFSLLTDLELDTWSRMVLWQCSFSSPPFELFDASKSDQHKCLATF